jgi:protein-disulfide isomerase
VIERLSKSPLGLAALIVVAALAGAVAMLLWQGRAPIGGERARMQAVVRDYLLDHPEILPEAMSRLRDRENGTVIAANRDAIYKPVGSAWAGNPNGDLTIVEYFDYNCGYCRANLPTIAKLLASDPKLRIVYRELPVLSEESKLAARYSLVAARAGKFAAFHQALYDGGPISDHTLADALAKAGIDAAQAKAQINDPAIDAEIENNYAMYKQLGMTGTPTWLIGDHVVSSMLSLEALQTEIAKARARG